MKVIEILKQFKDTKTKIRIKLYDSEMGLNKKPIFDGIVEDVPWRISEMNVESIGIADNNVMVITTRKKE